MGHTLQILNEFVHPARARTRSSGDVAIIRIIWKHRSSIKIVLFKFRIIEEGSQFKPVVALSNENVRVTEMDVSLTKSFL